MVGRFANGLRSLAFYAAFYVGSIFCVLATIFAYPMGAEPFRKAVVGWSKYHRICVNHILRIAVRIEGEQPTGSVLIALKHEAFYEAIDLPYLFDNPVVFAKAELLRIPLWGTAGKAYGLIAVERDQGAKALRHMLKSARAQVRDGRCAVVFPEGRRIPHGDTAPLQAGFAALYKTLKLPVVPVAVDSGPLYHRRWKKPGTITYRFGEPIEPGLPREEMERRVTEAINALNNPG